MGEQQFVGLPDNPEFQDRETHAPNFARTIWSRAGEERPTSTAAKLHVMPPANPEIGVAFCGYPLWLVGDDGELHKGYLMRTPTLETYCSARHERIRKILFSLNQASSEL